MWSKILAVAWLAVACAALWLARLWVENNRYSYQEPFKGGSSAILDRRTGELTGMISAGEKGGWYSISLEDARDRAAKQLAGHVSVNPGWLDPEIAAGFADVSGRKLIEDPRFARIPIIQRMGLLSRDPDFRDLSLVSQLLVLDKLLYPDTSEE